MTRVRILAALAAAVLALSVVPASAQDDPTDNLPDGGDGLPEDGDGLEGDEDADSDADGGTQAEGADLPGDADGGRFIATADGGGFDVQLAGEGLTIGVSRVGVQSSGDGDACDDALACAFAAGEAALGDSATVAVTTGADSADATAFDLDELRPLLSGAIGTALANASAEDGLTTADAEGGALDAKVVLTQELADELPAELTEGLEELLSALEDAGGEEDGDGGGETPLDDLIGSLEGELENLDAEEIESILGEAGLASGAQTQQGATTQPTVDDVAAELVDANHAAAQEGDDPADVDEDADAVEDVADESGQAGDGDGDEPSPEAIAALIEEALGGDSSAAQNPEGLVGDLIGALEQLVDDLTSRPLAHVVLGPTTSQAEDDGGLTTAAANSQGAVVVLLPTDDSTPQNPEGLVTVEAGASSASVASDRVDPTAEFDPALVRLGVANPITNEVEEIEVAPGQSECGGASPIVVCVSAGHGDTNVEGGGASAASNAVSLTALEDPLPQLSVELAAATAAVNADDAPVGPQEQPVDEPEPDPTLPVTGGGALVPGLLLLGAGVSGFAALRRRE